MENIKKGDIIQAPYVDMSPRFFLVIKITKEKVFTYRLPVSCEDWNKPLVKRPITNKKLIWTKKDGHLLRHGMVATLWTVGSEKQ